MQNIKERFLKLVPAYCLLPLIACFVWNSIIYNGTRLINGNMKHYDMTTSLDNATPVIPEFMLIYFGCFLFWGIYYIMCGRVSKDYCAKFVTFDMLTRAVCGVFFLILPTTNVRPVIENTDFFSWVLNFLYSIDAADNLFPSIHCLVSWNCFVGIRKVGIYSYKAKLIAFIGSILVFLSTLFTKQHVIADVISAVILSELMWFIVDHTKFYKKTGVVIDKVNGSICRVFRKRDKS